MDGHGRPRAERTPPFNLSWGAASSGSSYSHLDCPSLTSGSYHTETQAQTCMDPHVRAHKPTQAENRAPGHSQRHVLLTNNRQHRGMESKMNGSITSNGNGNMIHEHRNNNMGDEQAGRGGMCTLGNPRAYVCVSSHLRPGPERQSLLAREKLGAGMSSHTAA